MADADDREGVEIGDVNAIALFSPERIMQAAIEIAVRLFILMVTVVRCDRIEVIRLRYLM